MRLADEERAKKKGRIKKEGSVREFGSILLFRSCISLYLYTPRETERESISFLNSFKSFRYVCVRKEDKKKKKVQNRIRPFVKEKVFYARFDGLFVSR